MKYNELYKEAVNDLNPSQELIDRIKVQKEKKIMKFSKRKVAVVAAIACMTIGTTAFAAGHISTYYSSSDPRTTVTDYNKTLEKAEKTDVQINIPEELKNGYHFDNSNEGWIKGADENGTVVAKGDSFMVTYTKQDCPYISLNIEPVFEAGDYSNATASRDINGVTVYYNEDVYKFVPTDYKLTEEDKQNIDDPHYEISYGSDKVEVQKLSSIIFELDGKSYDLLSFDNDLTEEDWFAMAEEFIK